jgi:hypothetical protein
MTNKMDWIDSVEKTSGEFFKIVEGDNRIQLLSHAAPYPQHWNGSRYEPAKEGDENVSIKGVCWILQDGVIKSASLPYTVVKQVRALMEDADYAFEEFPMPRLINIKAKNAGSKEVEYSVVPSPKETEVSSEVLDELSKKPTPEDMVEKFKSKVVSSATSTTGTEYPEQYPETDEDIASSIPF